MTSYDNATPGTGSVVNDVQLVYNDFQQLVSDYQSHSGAVTSSTPSVGYRYEDGTDNTIRLNTLFYPNGRQLYYIYGTTGNVDDLLSRVSGIGDGTTTTMVAYTKLGLDRTVVVAYVQPGVRMTYIKLSGEPVGDGGDQYTGLDRFGRVVDNRWMNSSNVDVDRFNYPKLHFSNICKDSAHPYPVPGTGTSSLIPLMPVDVNSVDNSATVDIHSHVGCTNGNSRFGNYSNGATWPGILQSSTITVCCSCKKQ